MIESGLYMPDLKRLRLWLGIDDLGQTNTTMFVQLIQELRRMLLASSALMDYGSLYLAWGSPSDRLDELEYGTLRGDRGGGISLWSNSGEPLLVKSDLISMSADYLNLGYGLESHYRGFVGTDGSGGSLIKNAVMAAALAENSTTVDPDFGYNVMTFAQYEAFAGSLPGYWRHGLEEWAAMLHVLNREAIISSIFYAGQHHRWRWLTAKSV